MEVHVFRATEFHGEITESEEMAPQWFAHDAIPYASMWLDDEHWFKYLLGGKSFQGKALFRGTEVMLAHEFFAVDEVNDSYKDTWGRWEDVTA
jgi:hypothetical protein